MRGDKGEERINGMDFYRDGGRKEGMKERKEEIQRWNK